MRGMLSLAQCACLLGAWTIVAQAACSVDQFAVMDTLGPSAAGYLRALAWVPAADNGGGADLLLAGGEDQKLRVWELRNTVPLVNGSLINTLGSIHGTVWSLKWISTHSVLASGSGDGFIRIWPLSVLNTSQACHVEALGNGNALCCDGDGLGCEGKHVVSWRDAQMTRAGQVHALEWIDTHSILASAWSDGVVRLWTYTHGNTPPLAYRNSLSVTGRAYSLTWLESPGQLAVASPDWPLPELWDKDNTTDPARVLTKELPEGFGYCPTAHCGGVGASAANSDGTTLATGSEDTKVKLWDASTGALVHTLEGHAGTAGSLVWLDSDSRIVSGGADGSLLLWDPSDLGSSSPLWNMTGAHSNRVSALVWMSSLNTLASASYDLTIKLWQCDS